MKIVHPDLENEIILNNKNVAEWIIESPELFLTIFVRVIFTNKWC